MSKQDLLNRINKLEQENRRIKDKLSRIREIMSGFLTSAASSL